ncbi:methyl-accepting chemotaxis sensory transducer [Candidatus Vecturithrix granuli]|uniref:Methyl-accepting chemotaxis sensory transducer n=1 Tax=Vecturithrix granuli TaxID=1499967 RepID=A0A081BUU5_VECG1|nr:methyl-accepting chemotaxis sensory transducer [Candidatus Vecturithrix granuli]
MMKTSIQTKLLALCLLLVLLTTVSMSIAYYTMTRQDKHRESRQRIRIAFDIILDDLRSQQQSYISRFNEFLTRDVQLSWITGYLQVRNELGSTQFIASSLAKISEDFKNSGASIATDRLFLYGANKRLLVAYRRDGSSETVGGYVISGTGQDTYLPMDDFEQISAMYYQNQTIPDNPLPEGLKPFYGGEMPTITTTQVFREGGKLGLQILAPIYYNEKISGLLVGEIVYTDNMIERFASLSETAVNFFAGTQFNIGTLPLQQQIDADVLEHAVTCDALLDKQSPVEVIPITFNTQHYYQGRCVLKNTEKAVGAITVSFSQEIEKQAIAKIITTVLTIAAIVSGVAFALSILFSRGTIHSIQETVAVIVSAAEGDLRQTARVLSHDELGMLATKLNQMITQLRSVSSQVQQASNSVNSTADSILQQMEILIKNMEQQAGTVDNTTLAIKKIREFIEDVSQNTNTLLSAAAEILSSIQETRASVAEVTTSTNSLTTDLVLISSSVDQINQTMKQIGEHTGQLEHIAQETETEVQHIDQSLRNVSLNADQTQQFAKATMEAAIHGQKSVEASMNGMDELKAVVLKTAQIIQEVNTWSERISSILNMVDDIAEQTSLLSLNASIISAQAGVHGKGFAVVANEIKELATRTKASTREISSLIHEFQKKAAQGVEHTAEGLKKTDQGIQLAHAVQESLATILDSATHSSTRAADTAQVIQQTAISSQAINTQMNQMTSMASSIKTAIQQQEHDIEQVSQAVESISGMSEQVNRASLEQKRAAEEIAQSMEYVTDRFNGIAAQTDELKLHSEQMVNAMDTIETITENILQKATDFSGDTVKNLVQQSDLLQQIVKVFKVS